MKTIKEEESKRDSARGAIVTFAEVIKEDEMADQLALLKKIKNMGKMDKNLAIKKKIKQSDEMKDFEKFKVIT